MQMKGPTANQYAQRYLNYLRLAGSVEVRLPLRHLDGPAEHLLLYLGLTWQSGTRVTVVQAIKECPAMSSATAHRRLKMLREHGFITLEMDEEDNRIKYVVSTALTQNYFAQMGKCLAEASP